jgi:hypothetical protein
MNVHVQIDRLVLDAVDDLDGRAQRALVAALRAELAAADWRGARGIQLDSVRTRRVERAADHSQFGADIGRAVRDAVVA